MPCSDTLRSITPSLRFLSPVHRCSGKDVPRSDLQSLTQGLRGDDGGVGSPAQNPAFNFLKAVKFQPEFYLTVGGGNVEMGGRETRSGDKRNEGLEAWGLSLTGMKKHARGDARRAAMAELWWKTTTVSRAWIAEKLSMKSAVNVGMAIRRLENGEIKRDYSRELKDFIPHANESH